MTCAVCGSALAAGAKFCSECGTPTAERTAVTAERRITSVLFADLVGFTTLSESRDPEEVRELLSRYFATARTVADRYGGTIEKFIGDAVMAVWGVPTAHEDDAERAVRAGLDLVQAVASFGASVGAPDLAVRVGVVTGEVVVTVGALHEGMVAGDAVNTAARVQSSAPAGQVWVDAQTHALARASVDFTDTGEHRLKGKEAPVRLFVATALRGGRAGARSGDRVQAPLVGRQGELEVVKELFHVTLEQQDPRMLVLSGDAGLGKSRLAWELRNYLDGLTTAVLWHVGHCPAYGDGLAFAALTEVVRHRLGLEDGADAPTVLAALDSALDEHVPDADERSWIGGALRSLLGLTGDDRADREELFGAWIAWFERLHESTGSASVWVIEDAHLADEGLLDFVERLVMVARAPLLIVLTARPELLSARPWLGSLRRSTVVELRALDRAEVADLLTRLVEDASGDIVDVLVDRVEGNPLFALETVRSLQDQGLAVDAAVAGSVRLAPGVDRERLRALAAPASLQILVASRLDLLAPSERAVLAVAAVLGSPFTAAAVSALAPRVVDVPSAIRELCRRDLVTPVGDRPSISGRQYAFVQGVVRHVAYATQSRRDRLTRHLAAADHFEPLADNDRDLGAVIATHLKDALTLTRSGDSGAREVITDRLRGWLERVARRAAAVGAPAEAVRRYLEIIELGVDAVELVRLRLAAAGAASAAGAHDTVIELAGTVLATADVPTRGDLGQASALASMACRRRGDYVRDWTFLEPYAAEGALAGLPALVAARLVREIGAYHAETGRLEDAWRWQERSVALAEDTGDPREIVRSINNFAITAGNRGHARIAITLFQLCTDLARQNHLVAEYALPLDNLIAYMMNRDLDGALAASEESLQVGEAAGDSTGCWHTAANHAMLLVLAGRWDERAAVFDRPLLRERAAEPDQAAIRTLFDAVVAEARDEPVDLEALARVGAWADELPESTGTSYYLANRAMHARSVGETATMVRAATEAVATSHRYCGVDDDFPHVWTLAADWLLEAGELVAVKDLLRTVDAWSPTRWSPLLAAQVTRVRGTLAARDSDDAAGVELRSSIELLAAFHAVPATARAQAELGAWLTGRERADEAEAVLRAARETMAALDARRWLRELPVP